MALYRIGIPKDWDEVRTCGMVDHPHCVSGPHAAAWRLRLSDREFSDRWVVAECGLSRSSLIDGVAFAFDKGESELAGRLMATLQASFGLVSYLSMLQIAHY